MVEKPKISHAFMAHPEAISMYRAYHIVVLMDSTYKTNDYEYSLVEMIGVTPVGKNFTITYALVEDESTESYTWILQKLKSLLLNDVYPITIVTDRELGLGTAIKDVFPMSNHLLCTWYIYNAVEIMIHSVVKNEKLTKAMVYGGWQKVVEATTPSDLLCALDEFIRKYGKRGDGIVNYLQTISFVHVEKFCKAYTNKVLHLGNTATSRVKSAHAVLKSWLGSSTLALDTLWEPSHAFMNGQHIEIKALLNDSFSSKLHLHMYQGRLFSLLGGSEAKRAIVFMQEEYTRGVKLRVGLKTDCVCASIKTHGLHYACKLHSLYDDERKVHLDDIHVFWKTLIYSDSTKNVKNDLDIFNSLVDEIMGRDPCTLKRVNEVLFCLLHPEDNDVNEPSVLEHRKGRQLTRP